MNEKPNNAIFKATNLNTGEVAWIDDLYWFEEQGIHGMDGSGHYDDWKLEFVWVLPDRDSPDRPVCTICHGSGWIDVGYPEQKLPPVKCTACGPRSSAP